MVKIGSMELTAEQARKAGLLPAQRRARARRGLEILKAHGQENTQIASALRHVVKTHR